MTLPVRRPTLELLLVIVPGALNVLSEFGHLPKTLVVVGAAALWIVYVALAVVDDRTTLRNWGLRTDTLGPALRTVGLVTAAGTVLIVAWAGTQHRLPPPPTFWAALAVYPVWGLAQQFLLNAMLLRNLRSVLPERLALLLAGLLFAAAHLPDLPLVALTFPAGLAWGWIYLRRPNLWALGLGHGVLGTIAYYLALGRDPLAALGL